MHNIGWCVERGDKARIGKGAEGEASMIVETLRSRFDHFTAKDKLRFAIIGLCYRRLPIFET